MSWITTLFTQNEVTTGTVAIRLLLSMLLGGCIGWEREARRQPAGLRTHMLITLGSTLFTLVSIYIPQSFQNIQYGDPERIAAQVVSGIGFLGAGAIFRLGVTIKGLTTAATIWVAAAIGLAVGAGMYVGAIIGAFVILFVLIVLNKVEKRYFRDVNSKVLHLHFKTAVLETEEVFAKLKAHRIRVRSVNIKQSKEKGRTQMKLLILMPRDLPLKPFYQDMNQLNCLTEMTLGQDF